MKAWQHLSWCSKRSSAYAGRDELYGRDGWDVSFIVVEKKACFRWEAAIITFSRLVNNHLGKQNPNRKVTPKLFGAKCTQGGT